ncbi:hypothetical protein SAMN02745181_1268 [Rubritalea squalenifaciens DSM 18772]|uniref:Uncharacterized protein n=1 Tax=Rubritalea squalenifaciens DSM 18772 TaxID=1123071 RepID=A0A1M6GU25_9BACT|nr:hypothetical protein [Rubritalea squalenifaciens]SHJ13466.1 hypothetical protein SAMN02745181_1268 [Rubritalea squalenifaciens DSM 18772]
MSEEKKATTTGDHVFWIILISIITLCVGAGINANFSPDRVGFTRSIGLLFGQFLLLPYLAAGVIAAIGNLRRKYTFLVGFSENLLVPVIVWMALQFAVYELMNFPA